jgi:acyl carrier protein
MIRSYPMSEPQPIDLKVRRVLVETLRLKQSPESIAGDAPLFGGGGLGLDSVDALELVLAIEHTFHVKVEGQETGRRMLRSVDSIVAFLKEQGVEVA